MFDEILKTTFSFAISLNVSSRSQNTETAISLKLLKSAVVMQELRWNDYHHSAFHAADLAENLVPP